MAQSPTPPTPQSFLSRDHWISSQAWGWAGHSDSTSPASSSDSSGSCPCDGTRGLPWSEAPARSARATQTAPRRARSGPPGGQRQSASEREKLRMRTLARALQELRRFLPPSMAPAGQSLTKIETLRLAIRYISHLSAVLGLSEDSLQRRRRRLSSTSRGCPLCPDDGGPAQAQCIGSPAGAAAFWGTPTANLGVLAAPEHLESRVPDMNPCVSPPSYPSMQSSTHLPREKDPEAAVWMSLQTCSGTKTSLQPGSPAIPWTPAPVPPELAAVYQGTTVTSGSCLTLGTPPLLAHPPCQRLEPQTQLGSWSSSAEVLPSSAEQATGSTFQLSEACHAQSSDVQLSDCSELWEDSLEGVHLGIY